MGTWYSPVDEWPRHPAAHWRRALGRARRSGWWLYKMDGHTWGKVQCSPTGSVPDPDKMIIFTSGRGSEDVALELVTRVKRCTHNTPPAATADLVSAEEALDGAQTLVDASLLSIERDRTRREILEILEEAERLIDSSAHYARFDELDAADRAASHAIAEAAESAGHDLDSGDSPTDLVAAAERLIRDADDALAAAPSSGVRRELRKKARGIQARVRAVRRLLDEQ